MPRRRQRLFDIRVVVRGRDEARFERRWREINALLEHRVKKAIERWHVAGHDFRIR